MAFNFIKKVFSFGRTKDEAPAPEAEPQVETPAAPPETAPPETSPAQTPQADTAQTEAAPGPEPVAPDVTPDPDVEEPAAAATAETEQSFPHDPGEMHFTPETAGNGTLSAPEPEDEEHSGEPPLSGEKPDEGADAETPDQVTLADIAADPAIEQIAATEAFETADPEPAADIEPEPTPEPEPEPRKLIVRDEVSSAETAPEPAPAEPEPQGGWWQRLRQGLSRTSGQLTGQITGIFTKRKLDEETLEELEDVLLQADLGVETALRITDALASGRYGKDISPAEVQKVMADEIARVLEPVAKPLELDLSHKPHVILVVGVNGTGKTTTIGKLAAKLHSGGLRVTLAAGDTFRAAAIEQLKIWGDRTGSKVVSTKLGADAAGLAYEAFETARADGADVLIIDTAGRLQNRTELMDELAKVVRVIGKLDPDAPHTVLQTLDATTGQNALNQVEIFKNVAGVNGLVMTKLDGTARGGILVAIAAKHKLPVYFIGVGEGVDDLEPFEAADFASAIAGEPT